MAAIKCLVLLLSFTAISSGASVNNRIVGGEVASTSEFPWTVSLRANYGRHFCGGTLISSSQVVTAAHCVVSRVAANVHVVTGSNSLAEGGEFHAVSEIEYHANYSAGSEYSWENDIAILTLATTAAVSNSQSPAVVGTTYVEGNTSAQTSGWGRTIYPGNSLPTALQKLNLTILSNAECQTYHTLTIHDSHICALATYGEGICSGDSGTGLLVDGALVGITSWARLCAVGVPDVYTRVSSFTDWIIENTN